jgi:hypothetical protein
VLTPGKVLTLLWYVNTSPAASSSRFSKAAASGRNEFKERVFLVRKRGLAVFMVLLIKDVSTDARIT